MELSQEEIKRYSRHIILDKFGIKNQLKLKASKVLVVGAGGLGSPLLLYLTAAGIGKIGVVDNDVVDVSNLQRQIIFTEEDIGKNKAIAANDRLKKLNALITFEVFPFRITGNNALPIIEKFDVIVDCTDNFATRYLLNDACVILDKPLVYGSILEYEGHASSFNLKTGNGENSANYRDAFPSPPSAEGAPNCEEAGVLGVLPGLIGVIQAHEVIKIITGIGEPLSDKLLIIDSLSMEQTTIKIRSTAQGKSIRQLIDYEEFCGISEQKNKSLEIKKQTMKEVTVEELKSMLDKKSDFQLIDVREPHEYDICNLGGKLIPQGDIPSQVDQISKDKQVVIHCRSGARSGNMVQWLEKNHGFTNLYNLKGGILAWAREIDPSMPTY